MKAYTTYSTKKTPQSEPIPGKDMARNSAGGFTFEIDDWKRLERFLILGSEGGTYYVSERKLTRENADCVLRCINNDGIRTVDKIIEISDSGRAPKNDPALFALAMCAGLGDEVTKKAAFEKLPKVARIGTHLFHFVAYVEQFRGWGRSLSNAIKKWYQEKSVDDLAYQVVKYQQRDGWSHRDLLRLSHPKPTDNEHNSIYKWIVSGEVIEPIHKLIEGFEKAKTSDKPDIKLIIDYSLTREMIPTNWLNYPEVWEALLDKMPMTAMIRNLNKMTAVGLIKPMSSAANKIISALSDQERLRKSRIHPLAILVALRTYQQGHGDRGKLSWNPISQIIDTLDSAFYLTFETIESTGKRWLLGLDVSGSMAWNNIAGMPITPREASAAMALITAATEKNYHIMGFAHDFRPLSISPRQRLDDVVKKISDLDFDATDCSLPMLWAIKNKVEIDAFVTYCVDKETEILTASGWKKFDELQTGEEVYTLNHNSGIGEWQRVRQVNIFPAIERDMILIEGRGHSSLTTPNHRWPVCYRGNSSWGRRWKTSETLNMVDYIQCAAVDSNLPTEKKWSNEFVELVAWAWTEGYWNDSEGLSIVQSNEINAPYCNRIKTVLQSLFREPVDDLRYWRGTGKPKWSVGKYREDILTFRLNKAAAKQVFSIIGRKKVVSKHWLRELTLNQLQLFIDVSLLADGHKERKRIAQKDPERAEAFAFACILAGMSVSYTHINNDYNNHLEIGILQRRQFAPLQHAYNKDNRPFSIKKIRYKAIVWCPTTSNGTWLARRNGTVYWTGNTDSETWVGEIHPCQALQQYRQEFGIAAKLIVVGMTATKFSIADPDDAGMLDVVGFDTSTPQVMSDFIVS